MTEPTTLPLEPVFEESCLTCRFWEEGQKAAASAGAIRWCWRRRPGRRPAPMTGAASIAKRLRKMALSHRHEAPSA